MHIHVVISIKRESERENISRKLIGTRKSRKEMIVISDYNDSLTMCSFSLSSSGKRKNRKRNFV